MPIKTNQKNSVNSVNNKTGDVVLNAADLGVASATDLAQTDGHLQDLTDLVGDKVNLPMPNETVVDNIEYVDKKADKLIDDLGDLTNTQVACEHLGQTTLKQSTKYGGVGVIKLNIESNKSYILKMESNTSTSLLTSISTVLNNTIEEEAIVNRQNLDSNFSVIVRPKKKATSFNFAVQLNDEDIGKDNSFKLNVYECTDIINRINKVDNKIDDFINYSNNYLITYFKAENTNGVYLGISYDGKYFEEIGKIFENDETRDPCIIKKDNVYYLIYSHWGEFKKMTAPVYRSTDLINWSLHTTLNFDLSGFGNGYDEIWAPEFFLDNDGTMYLSFGSRISASNTVNAFLGTLSDDLTRLVDCHKIDIPYQSGNTFDLSFINDNGTYYCVGHGEGWTPYNTHVYKSNYIFGTYTICGKLPASSYNEGMCILKNQNMFMIYADENKANGSEDERNLVLYTSKTMSKVTSDWNKVICGSNMRHSKIIFADKLDTAKLERAYTKMKLIN